jgi:hypothetical protein
MGSGPSPVILSEAKDLGGGSSPLGGGVLTSPLSQPPPPRGEEPSRPGLNSLGAAT